MKKPKDDFRDIERLVAYKHAFPSPKMQFIHAAEYDSEDGVMIISIEQLMMSLRKPDEYYHISYHIWAQRFVNRYSDFPQMPHDFKEKIASILPYDYAKIDQLLGYEVQDYRPVALASFFIRAENFKRQYPEFYAQLAEYCSK